MAQSEVMERIYAHVPKTTERQVGRGRVIKFPDNWQFINRGREKCDPPEIKRFGVPAASVSADVAPDTGV